MLPVDYSFKQYHNVFFYKLGWKAKLLSQAGRAVIIKSALSAYASYQMQCISFTKTVLDNFDKIQRELWWNKKDAANGIYTKAWVNNGSQVSIWSDHWLPKQDVCIVPKVVDNDLLSTINQLTDGHGNLNDNMINKYIHYSLHNKIKSIALDPMMPDRIRWKHANSDSTHYAVLETQLNEKLFNDDIRKGSVVQLFDYMSHTIQNRNDCALLISVSALRGFALEAGDLPKFNQIHVLIGAAMVEAMGEQQWLIRCLNTQNQILDILQGIGDAGNNYKKDDHKGLQNPSSSDCHELQARILPPKALLIPEEDTAKVAENVKNTPSLVFGEITGVLPKDDRNVHYQQRSYDHQLGEFKGNHTTLEQNLQYKGEKVMSKKYVLNGYKQLYFAAYNGDWEKASKFFENNPQAIGEVVTEEQETALHIAAHRNHLVFIEEIVRCMPPEVLEYKTRYTKSTALHFAVMHGNLKAAEVMYKKNQKLTQIQDGDGLVPLAYALVCATGAQEEMVKYLYPITREDDPSPFSGHCGGFYDFASSLVERFPGLVSTKSKWSKEYGVEVLVEKPFTFFSGAKLTWWERYIYPLIQVDMDAARGHDSQVDEKNPWGIDEGNKRVKGKYSERTESDEENPSQSITGDAGNSSKASEGDEEDLLESSEVSTSKDPSIIKFISVFYMPYLMRGFSFP
ncbi:uncharacterized protein LOC113335599 [Papaver somniferum]|uniref:uncharacterized protein LOC113335599 n=1 Tax=Papaver somniferum TaxID=3469 RepID=UPI000E6F8F37|nr:uncharacterized protein LOC113335599 [Papaver somniferum]